MSQVKHCEWPKPIQCAALQLFTAFQMDTKLFDWNMLITKLAIHLNSVVMWKSLLLKCVTPKSMEWIAALSSLIHQFLPEILYDFQHYHFAPTGVRDVLYGGTLKCWETLHFSYFFWFSLLPQSCMLIRSSMYASVALRTSVRSMMICEGSMKQ